MASGAVSCRRTAEYEANCKRQKLIANSTSSSATNIMGMSQDVCCGPLQPGMLTIGAVHKEPSRVSAPGPQPMAAPRRSASGAACPLPKPPAVAAAALNQDDIAEDLQHCLQRQAVFQPSGIFTLQPQLTALMRRVLVEWMFEVTLQYKLQQETFLLAVNIMDRYLCKRAVSMRAFQLLGTTCLWLAAKYEEVAPPPAQYMVDMTDNSYTAEDLKVLERDVLAQLNYELCMPTAQKFLHMFLVKAQVKSKAVLLMAECLVALSYLDAPRCAEAPPSQLAAASLCAALSTCGMASALPLVITACQWADTMALANLAQDLYKAFAALCSPGARYCPMVDHFLQRQQDMWLAGQPLAAASSHAGAPPAPNMMMASSAAAAAGAAAAQAMAATCYLNSQHHATMRTQRPMSLGGLGMPQALPQAVMH